MKTTSLPIKEALRGQEQKVEPLAVSAARLAVGLEGRVSAGENLGDLELAVEQQSRELLRQATEKAAQQKADATPPRMLTVSIYFTRCGRDVCQWRGIKVRPMAASLRMVSSALVRDWM